MSDTVTLSISLPADDDGYIDRQCQFEDCEQYFKVLESDWDAREPDILHCPVCGYRDEAGKFSTRAQDAYAEEVALAYLQGELKNVLEGVAKRVNRTAVRNQVFSIRLTNDYADLDVPLSPAAAESLTMRIACEHCGCRFAVQGPGSFCPLCARNLSVHTFRQAIELARNTVSVIVEELNTISDPRVRALGRAKVIENQIINLVTAFQHFAEALYDRLPNKASLKRNALQNLERASSIWEEAAGTALTTYLGESEWQTLNKYFQQRHVLEHQSGIVDAKYIRDSGDTTFSVGRRLVIRPVHVVQMAGLVEKLGLGMLCDVPEAYEAPDLSANEAESILFPTQLPGVTDFDWAVYRAVCEMAISHDYKTLAGQSVWDALSRHDGSEQDFADSLDILESKGLVSQYRTIDRSPIPRQVSLAPRGHELYFKHIRPAYREEQKQIGTALLGGITTSDAIHDLTGLPNLLILHTLNDFASRNFVADLTWSDGVAYAFVVNPVFLKRFVGE